MCRGCPGGVRSRCQDGTDAAVSMLERRRAQAEAALIGVRSLYGETSGIAELPCSAMHILRSRGTRPVQAWTL